MKTAMLIIMVATFAMYCGGTTPLRPSPPNVVARFPGRALNWIHAAQPQLEKEKLDISKYFVTVVEEDDSVSVILTGSRPSKEVRGDPGPTPGYEVEISKKDLKVVGANYIR
jgi:hypothetical protein